MKFNEEIMEKLIPLSSLNNYRGILALSIDWFFIICSIVVSSYFENIIIYILAIIIIGTRQRALATILHESAHRTLAENLKLNDFLGKYPSGYMIFQSFQKYAKSHVILHHNFLGDEKKDPDYIYYIESGLFSQKTKSKFLWENLFSVFLLRKTPSFIKYLLKNRLGDKKDPELKKILIMWAVIISLSVYFNSLSYVVLYWIVPLITTFPIVGWFIEMAEHYPIIKNKNDIGQTWNRFSSPLELFLTGIHNENMHLTHHLMPNIPYWNLIKAHKIMLEDPLYMEHNKFMGGIFLSSNGNKSLWGKIIEDYDFKMIKEYQDENK